MESNKFSFVEHKGLLSKKKNELIIIITDLKYFNGCVWAFVF